MKLWQSELAGWLYSSFVPSLKRFYWDWVGAQSLFHAYYITIHYPLTIFYILTYKRLDCWWSGLWSGQFLRGIIETCQMKVMQSTKKGNSRKLFPYFHSSSAKTKTIIWIKVKPRIKGRAAQEMTASISWTTTMGLVKISQELSLA